MGNFCGAVVSTRPEGNYVRRERSGYSGCCSWILSRVSVTSVGVDRRSAGDSTERGNRHSPNTCAAHTPGVTARLRISSHPVPDTTVQVCRLLGSRRQCRPTAWGRDRMNRVCRLVDKGQHHVALYRPSGDIRGQVSRHVVGRVAGRLCTDVRDSHSATSWNYEPTEIWKSPFACHTMVNVPVVTDCAPPKLWYEMPCLATVPAEMSSS
jgi:hypothetical protein